jgi:hypothetical protein
MMIQNWGKLLFMHWPVRPEVLRPLIPARLELETFDGAAWLGVVPFTMWGIRHAALPPIPGLNAFHELNVRTYVKINGEPGVWFFSLDAANRVAVWAARKYFRLPYYLAEMSLKQLGPVITYASRRVDRRGEPMKFEAEWEIGGELPRTKPGSLEFFLTERYCLFTGTDEELLRARVEHVQWPLRSAKLRDLRETTVSGGFRLAPRQDAHLLYAESLRVKIFPLQPVRS